MKTPKIFLDHIINASNEIKAFTKNVSRNDFMSDSMRYYAVIHLIELIGEASSKLESDFKTSHPKIPWAQIKAMRNQLTHAYWDTNLNQVWHTATIDIPKLKQDLLPILHTLEAQEAKSPNKQQ